MHTIFKHPSVPLKPIRRVSPRFPFEFYCLSGLVFQGPYAGSRNGRPIFKTAVDENGVRYRFLRQADRDGDGRLDVAALKPGEWIVQPDLVYAEERLLADPAIAQTSNHDIASKPRRLAPSRQRTRGRIGRMTLVSLLAVAAGGILCVLL